MKTIQKLYDSQVSTINISVPKYIRKQVDDLVDQGVFSTFSEAVRRGLSLLIYQERIKLWDGEIFVEYEAGVLCRHPRSGILLSRKFQKDLNLLVKKEPELRRGVWVTLQKITQKKHSLKIIPLELKNYYLVEFVFRKNNWRILIRKQHQDLIACRIGFTTDFIV